MGIFPLAPGTSMIMGHEAIKLGIAAYIVPFLFAYHPELPLQGEFLGTLHAVITALIGISLIAIGIEGFLFRELHWIKRIILLLGGLGALIPGWISDFIGLALGISILLIEWKARQKGKKAA